MIPPDVRAHFRQAATRGRQLEKEWQAAFRAYAAAYPALAEEIRGMSAGKHSSVWEQHLPKFSAKQGLMATRQASGEVLNAIAQDLPLLFGGSADLTPSNNTTLKNGNPSPLPCLIARVEIFILAYGNMRWAGC